jgi:hypothetical protein
MTKTTRVVLLTMSLLGPVAWAVAQPRTLNDKVVQFCKDKLGEKVGDGECFALAYEALMATGAKPPGAFKDFPNKEDYVWGNLVYALEIKGGSRNEKKVRGMSVKPGDVIQLGDATFEGQNLRGFEVYSFTYTHHTVVVGTVQNGGKMLTAFEQNVNDKKIVMATPYRLSDLKTGWVRIYRPVPK